ncbi:Borealin N terminal-domain-containing protein [Truncatella angustata]|uniref:Borealin N terminal-domain-containing protein n=1 Tax=Truncatella angustata TaxID=152316 RepID=A0A9P8RI41_9PEZI|nr:Borealin N terminal-domain-containing protein [Truncatella angustata]KAH6646449.1 Borealin N terminal-domain-containing protein [Truncatella angustata]KAH8200706.1 hypothetical protein TruAng_005095 [Truncatella angustata]
MAPVRTRKRKSDLATSSPQRSSPIKKRKMALTAAQKQALIDNLQLELTERARRLRSQYNIQAQQLRSRVEMRVNRIPNALRKLRMGDLLAKHSEPQQSRASHSLRDAKPPPVPVKDGASPKPIPRKPVPGKAQRGSKRLSNMVDETEDKENSLETTGNPKKKLRGVPAVIESARIQPGQILSPTSTNARIVPRVLERPPPAKMPLERPATSPGKSMIARPASPIKAFGRESPTKILSNMVSKAKATRGAASTGTRKGTASTTASSNSGTVPRVRKPAVPTASATGSTRGRKKLSQASESSEASTGTVIKKTTAASRAATAKPAPGPKRTVMGTIKSATTKKAPAAKAPAAAATTTTTGRTLRKRQA